MAVFGIPQAHEDDALRAVRAAAEMREAVSRLGLEARTGVNTGEVFAGKGETLVTKVAPFTDEAIGEAFRAMLAGEVIRTVIAFD